jgi:lipase
MSHPINRAPIEHRIAVNDITLTAFEWNRQARGDADTLLLAHATGFHARCWDQVVALLGDHHVIAVDQRGHGRSGGMVPIHWRQFGHDLAQLTRTLDLSAIVGVGHSMGGHAMTEAAALEAGRFRRLVLIDPVIIPAELYDVSGRWTGRFDGQHPTAKRRRHWNSPEEIFERFKDRPPFDTWNRRVLRDYCTYGVLPDASSGGFVLACHPELEAEVYMTSCGNGGIYDRVRAIDIPVLVVRTMEPPPDRSLMDFRFSPTWPGLARMFRHGRDLHLADRTHFLPMEDPALTAALIRDDARGGALSTEPSR